MKFARGLSKYFRKFSLDQINQESELTEYFRLHYDRLNYVLIENRPGVECRTGKPESHEYKTYNDRYFAQTFS